MHDARRVEIPLSHKQVFCYVGGISVELPKWAEVLPMITITLTLTLTQCHNDHRQLVPVNKDFPCSSKFAQFSGGNLANLDFFIWNICQHFAYNAYAWLAQNKWAVGIILVEICGSYY